MRRMISLAGIAGMAIAAFLIAAPHTSSDVPQYTSGGQMLRPSNYREWTWISSGLGMSYSAQSGDSDEPSFDNVFVNPAAYRSFVQSGRWPDKTTLVVEVRASQTKGSINLSGHFQDALLGLEIHVKDESRFSGKWAFFGFGADDKSAAMIPTSADCYSCHEQHGAVDTTFVQFYPTLLDVAKEKHTLTKY